MMTKEDGEGREKKGDLQWNPTIIIDDYVLSIG